MAQRQQIRQKAIATNKTADASPLAALGGSNQGETRVSLAQMNAIRHLYDTNPSLKAARTLLMGQLLSSGIVLRRNGEAVQLKQTFEDHLRSYWIPFARSLIDSFLCFGFATVSIEEEPRKPFSEPAAATAGDTTAAPALVARSNPADVSAATAPAAKGANLVPIVPTLGTYEIVLVPTGRGGYLREAQVFTTAATHAYQRDSFMEVFFRDYPDANGNCVSPISSIFNTLTYIEQLKELAMVAEITRAQPTLVTQSIGSKTGGGGASALEGNGLNLFFDSESRDLQQQTTDEQSVDRQKQLQMVVALAGEVNRLRTTNVGGNPITSSAPPPPSAPDVPPRLFALPEKQSLVPNALQPTSRTDLEQLMRFSNEAVCSALGVPASVLFEGRFSSNSMSQLQLLNTVVASIAVSVNDVLSQTYTALYGKGKEAGELVLSTAPLCATTEVQQLYAAGILDDEVAVPSAMHSLGCSATEISSAVERRRQSNDLKRKADELQTKVTEAEGNARIRAANSAESDVGKASTPASNSEGKKRAPPSEVGSSPDE